MVKYQLYKFAAFACFIAISFLSVYGSDTNCHEVHSLFSISSPICDATQTNEVLCQDTFLIDEETSKSKISELSDSYPKICNEEETSELYENYLLNFSKDYIYEAIKKYYEKQWNGIPWHLMVIPFIINLALCVMAIIYQHFNSNAKCKNRTSIEPICGDIIRFNHIIYQANLRCNSDCAQNFINSDEISISQNDKESDGREHNQSIKENEETFDDNDTPIEDIICINKPLIMDKIKLISFSEKKTIHSTCKRILAIPKSSSLNSTTTSISQLSN